ncbi:restriction endonuclease subunit S [Micromonospora coerulea]|uniref:restriction endonuclease subunit S n=1 Tax=Micromonospora coerulea TaxID=47856 RepID=UPI001903E979|nr:restriction endonuclease subunit S [Micromonospora veneta]
MTFPRTRLKFLLSRSDAGAWGDDAPDDDGVPVLRSTDIDLLGRIDGSNAAIRRLSGREKFATRLEREDILVVKSSGSDAHLGKSGYVESSDTPVYFSNFLQRLRVVAQVEPRFVWYFLNSQDMKSQIREISSTTTGLQNLTGGVLGEAAVPCPPLSDQRRIADFLDVETAHIDELDAARSRHLELLQELSAAHVASAFELEATVPKVRLGYLATIQTGVTVDASRSAGSDAVTRPYLRVANVQAGYLDLNQITEITVPRRLAAASTLQAGDVLMTEGGDLDKLGRGTVWEGQIEGCLHQNHVFAVRVNRGALDADYLAMLTRATPARIHFESTGNKTTNLASTSSSKIRELRVPLPPISRQRAVVAEVKAALAAIEAIASAVRCQRKLLAERRQALITAAVTGQFDVTTAGCVGAE